MIEIIIGLVAVLAPFGAWLVATWRGKRIGKREAQYDGEIKDKARADYLRNNVAKRVHRDEIKYRD